MESMRDRLERLKNTSSEEFSLPLRREQSRVSSDDKKFLTPESQFMRKVDKAMMQIETLRTKMHSGTDQYISLYQELKKAEEDFLELLKDPERRFMDLPAAFVSRVEQTKKKLLTKRV